VDGDGTIRLFCVARPIWHRTGNIAISVEISNRAPESCAGVLVSARSATTLDIETTPWDVTSREGKIFAILPTYGAGMIEIRP
jgi:hypothetical protein